MKGKKEGKMGWRNCIIIHFLLLLLLLFYTSSLGGGGGLLQEVSSATSGFRLLYRPRGRVDVDAA